jgi:membrane protein DedA with SNARE-associated domain
MRADHAVRRRHAPRRLATSWKEPAVLALSWRRPALLSILLTILLLAVLFIYSFVTGVEVIDIDISLGTLQSLVRQVTGQSVDQILATYGYWTVLGLVAVESMGIPLPGETMLLVAAVYAGTTHHLLLPGVILAAAGGAVLGDNVGFLIGREGGYRLLLRLGPRVGLTERSLKAGRFIFLRRGDAVVFFGRFVSVLRMWAAFLAGANRMAWPRFLLWNAAGGLLWATLYGTGGYVLGANVHSVSGPVGIALMVVAGSILLGGFLFLRKNRQRLEEAAERALPGPLEPT